jgi:gamma-glutamyl-gamma-aminobutyrate hydrolase PuuD
VVGVLWHPEEDEEGGAALFEALVDQATTYRRAAA